MDKDKFENFLSQADAPVVKEVLVMCYHRLNQIDAEARRQRDMASSGEFQRTLSKIEHVQSGSWRRQNLRDAVAARKV